MSERDLERARKHAGDAASAVEVTERLANASIAQAYALIAIAEALVSGGAGYNLAEAVLVVGGIQP